MTTCLRRIHTPGVTCRQASMCLLTYGYKLIVGDKVDLDTMMRTEYTHNSIPYQKLPNLPLELIINTSKTPLGFSVLGPATSPPHPPQSPRRASRPPSRSRTSGPRLGHRYPQTRPSSRVLRSSHRFGHTHRFISAPHASSYRRHWEALVPSASPPPSQCRRRVQQCCL